MQRPGIRTAERQESLGARWSQVLATASPWHPSATRALLVVPHPDDEVLMFGGLIAALDAVGAPSVILAVTDGEAAYEGVDRTALARVRRAEQAAAVGALSSMATMVRLGLPDGSVPAHEEELAGVIADTVRTRRCDLVVAPWIAEGHGDHDSCGRAARSAVQTVDGRVALMHGLFWTWHWHDPATFEGHRLRALPVDASARHRTWSALQAHQSQLTSRVAPPILTPERLQPCRWPFEYYVDVEG